MKVVVALFMSLVVANAFAFDYQSEAEKQFAKMTASQAWNSGFKKQIMNVQIPGSSAWLNPSADVCISGNEMHSVNKISTCVAWSGKNGNGDTITISHPNPDDNFTCSKTTSAYVSSPLVYQKTVCTLWSANDDGDIKYFNTKSKAEKAGNNVKCAREESVVRTLPTTFAVKFYRVNFDSQNYLGTHSYAVPTCH